MVDDPRTPPTGLPVRVGGAVGDDLERPSSARVYDFLLGGTSHGEVDRGLGRDLIDAEPLVVPIVRENRSFLRRAVTLLAREGIDQFLDLGSGIPTMGNTHEVARRVRPDARVAYVDVDPVAVAHGELLLGHTDGVSVSQADLRRPAEILDAPAVTAVLDLARPVGLLLFSVLQHVPDTDEAHTVVDEYLSRLVPGSALAVSHLSADDPRVDAAALRRVSHAYPRGPVTPRSAAELARIVAGVELVDPGLVFAAQWRPEPPRPGSPNGEPCCGHRAAVGFVRAR
ncbi:SAM-dependent methyltransferase [Actinomycetospora cinnamomea]|uniref:S-adenosyl methyltransferase n=1 Tax=Actinomycetospora cinnamomea TaxID=663609 RepID=A0A2U1F6F8_9PSEU|nr:SAM-dependent methyltransferase [Actinomycetospora cinnamomea]PVZ07732.1 S-adenosyl methyltransferase [Actinomycetospora cinnamomea]